MDAASWLWVAIAAGVVAVLYGVVSMLSILKLPACNGGMQSIARAIQLGPRAFPNRQYSMMLVVGIVLFAVLWFALGRGPATGFPIGALPRNATDRAAL